MTKLNKVVLVGAIGLIVLNFVSLARDMALPYQQGKKRPEAFYGNAFVPWRQQLKNVEYVGYYTDQSLTDTTARMKYTQTQYILAPTLLDYEQWEKHRLFILDGSSPKANQLQVEKLGLRVLRRTEQGAILAEKPMS